MTNEETPPENVHICKRCGDKMKLRSAGVNRKQRYRCQSCHTKAVLSKYKGSTRRAIAKYRKTDKGVQVEKKQRERALDLAEKLCGVRSTNSLRSKRSELLAHNARQKWTIADDELVSCGKYTDDQLNKMLGRSIRAIQRRRARIKGRP